MPQYSEGRKKLTRSNVGEGQLEMSKVKRLSNWTFAEIQQDAEEKTGPIILCV